MIHLSSLVKGPLAFRTQAEVIAPLRAACAAHPDVAACHDLGASEEGRPLVGVVLGRGPLRISLIAGAHADEPAGPETLRTFILGVLAQRDRMADLLEACRFVIVPHINPDGEARNRAWIERWPDAEAYVRHRVRELPGRDLEFGFPEMRVENRLVAKFLRAHAPYHLHMSLHGMGIAEGGMLLIERHWTFRTQPLRDGFAEAVRAAGMDLHDHNRKGEKGFFYLEPGFTTTPEGEAMRTFFRAQGDARMAAHFHDSSMEFVRGLGGDPLCLVTELPLFTIARAPGTASGAATAYQAFRAQLPLLTLRARKGTAIAGDLAGFGVRPVPVDMIMRLQLRALELGLAAVWSG